MNLVYNFDSPPTTTIITNLSPINYSFTVTMTPNDAKCWTENPSYQVVKVDSGAPDIATIVNNNKLQINPALNMSPGVWEYKVVYSQTVPEGCVTPE